MAWNAMYHEVNHTYGWMNIWLDIYENEQETVKRKAILCKGEKCVTFWNKGHEACYLCSSVLWCATAKDL